ncbi:tyrosine-type recombinase/integrase [Rhizobium lemnae]|uniref:Tyrosine-type recombinase/integrase n=1 Tax=Rhizobium lemnae TaxID=1214924 RepID=A0ABV8E7S4_9HYPH
MATETALRLMREIQKEHPDVLFHHLGRFCDCSSPMYHPSKPYPSSDAMSAIFKRWRIDAGLAYLSAHGVREGLAELLAEMGCSQYEIMAILGHSEAKTSEVYTRRVERWTL